jgi:hypothetical protein
LATASQGRKPAHIKWKQKDLGLSLPRSGSFALLGFLDSFRQINDFLQFVLNLVSAVEHSATVSHNALVKIESDEAKKAEMIEKWKKRVSPVDDLKKHRQYFMEVVLVRHVENYLNYLSAVLREIFLTRPEALRSAEKIDLETVLKHESIEDLVKTIAEKKVESLSYASFSDLAQYFQEKFHLELVPAAKTSLVVDAIETRNISVHNRCIINQRYITRTSGDQSKLGSLKHVFIQEVEEIAKTLARSVVEVDKHCRKKLRVRGHRAVAAA